MKHHPIFLFAALLFSGAAAAQVHVGAFTGMSNYYGDLNDRMFSQPNPAVGISFNYEVSPHLSVRTGFTVGHLQGADSKSGSEVLETHRNLEFQSQIKEVSLGGELLLLDLNTRRWSPYGFAGVALFHFNPYATSPEGEKVYLQPLGTEGQGLPQYPDRQRYALKGLSLPVGGGIKFRLSDAVRVGLEVGFRKTFTDYLDDVSSTYADANYLLEGHGQESLRFSFRANENPLGRSTYPSEGEVRGNPGKKDSYYFTGIHFTFRMPGGGNRNGSRGNSRYSDLKCPPVPR